LIVGAYYASQGGENSGSAYVIFGKGTRYPTSINLSTLDGSNGFRIDGVTDYDLSGRSVSGAGDLNGDGLGDMIVGAPGSANNGERSGTSYIIYGQKPDAAVARVGSALDQTLAGGDFGDKLSAREGDDDLFGNGGDDTVAGGTGRDRMVGGVGEDKIFGGEGGDSAQGGADDDSISGDDGNDVLGGGAGRDALVGGKGTDRIYGGDGADFLVSSVGHDTIVGGTGADRFVFANLTWGGDQILDFEDGLDILRFKRFIADSVSGFSIIGNGTDDVILSIGKESLELHGIKPIFITNADFEFVA